MDKLLLDIPSRIEAERLLIRAYEPGDGSWYYEAAQRNRAHLQRYEPHNALMSINSKEEAEHCVREFAIDWMARRGFFLAVLDKASGEFVGQLFIGAADWNLPEFRIGYIADVHHQGRGYITEAVRAALGLIFNYLRGWRVSIRCDETNERSRRVAERCGFVLEGRLRRANPNPDGSYSDTLLYGLLRDEFATR